MVKKKIAFLSILLFYYAFATLLAIFCPLFLKAQTDTAKIKLLNEVQIKAKRHYVLQHSPAPVQKLANEELKQLNSLSVADAIRFFSGVQIKDYGGVGGLKTINVRSMGSNHTAVFFDGILIGNAQNGQVDLGRYSLENLEEISLHIGQNSQNLLPAKAFASASSLYLKSKVPQFKTNENQYFNATLKTGSFDVFNPYVSFTQKLNSKLAFNINGEWLNTSGKYKYRYTNGVYDTTLVRQNSDVDAKRFEGTLYGLTADSSKWQLKLYNYKSERGVPGAIVSNKYNFSQRQWDDNFFVQVSYLHNAKHKYQYVINAKYAYDFTRYLDPERILVAGPLDNRFTQHEAYFSIANQYKLNSYCGISLSADYIFQKLNANLGQFAYPTRHTGLVAIASNLTWSTFNLQANILATFVNDEVKTKIPAGKQTEFTPTLMASWQPFSKTDFRLRAFYKSIFRMPTFNDLYYTFIGNASLKPEYTAQYNLGFTYRKDFKNKQLKSISFQTDVYYNQVTDKILAVPTISLFRWTMLNIDEVLIKGLSFNAQQNWQLGKFNGSTKLNYTFERALDVTDNSFSYQQQIPYVPVNSGSLALGLNWKSYGLNYAYLYTGERYSQKANIPSNYIPAWYTHDLAVQKNFNIKKNNYRIAAEVNNLLNQYYDVVLNYPMPGRNFRLSFNANF